MGETQRTAIVTGASSGIGRRIATTLASEGMSIVVADVRRQPQQGKYFDTDITTPTDEVITDSMEEDAIFVETDVSSEDDVESLVERSLEVFGDIDVVVNNAGIWIPGSSENLPVEDWDKQMDVNLRGMFMTVKRAIPYLQQSEHGRVVNISSVYGHVGGCGPAYAASKAAILNLTRDVAIELADAGVTVNAVLPGAIKTAMQDDEDVEKERRRTPLSRLGEPQDVANAVSFFVSSEADWITGAELLVDGGLLASNEG